MTRAESAVGEPSTSPTKVFVVARVPRVSCSDHGVVVAAVPWARHGARHTLAFEQLAAWCAVEMSSTAAARLLRCTWRTIGQIIARVVADLGGDELLEGVTRIGIDEVAYRRHYRYLLVVVDHDRRRLIHAVDGAHPTSLNAFFDLLGEVRTQAITHVSADGAPWIARTVTRRCPKAIMCADTFHVVQWARRPGPRAPRTLERGARTTPARQPPCLRRGQGAQ